MHKHIFVNLGVRDLKRSMDFFGQLGFQFDPKFTNDQAACMVLGENMYAMLLTTDFMRKCTEVLTCLSCVSREEVDGLVEKALAAGGTSKRPPMECGTDMYGRSFEDLDGHIWELMYMSPAAVEKGAHGS